MKRIEISINCLGSGKMTEHNKSNCKPFTCIHPGQPTLIHLKMPLTIIKTPIMLGGKIPLSQEIKQKGNVYMGNKEKELLIQGRICMKVFFGMFCKFPDWAHGPKFTIPRGILAIHTGNTEVSIEFPTILNPFFVGVICTRVIQRIHN